MVHLGSLILKLNALRCVKECNSERLILYRKIGRFIERVEPLSSLKERLNSSK
jgi:hypothetical protein